MRPVVRIPCWRLPRWPLALLAPTLLAAGGACGRDGASPTIDTPLVLGYQQVASGLASPVYLTAPAGDARLFVVEQPGRIRIVKAGQLLDAPFLDISAKVASGGERGLLSMAFDPAYATNGRFYVYYTDLNGDITVERYPSTPGADVAGTTPTPVISIPHRSASNHNGGLVTFGPDGMLYMGTGDGGGGGDPSGNGQNQNVLLGKLLRLDVRTLPYTIPSSNPFVGQAGKRGEIWAYGLRNPWRFDFHTPPGTSASSLFIADVGQSAFEEIDAVLASTPGLDYGWNVMEGRACYTPATGCNRSGLQLPVFDYDHSAGCSITGGFVYRGAALPEVAGQYFYSDFCRGFLASLTGTIGGTFTSRTWSTQNVGSVNSFGEDASGELYVLTSGGQVQRIVRQ